MNRMIILALLITAALAVTYVFIIDAAYGTAIEDKGKTMKEKLLERAREWNIQKAINETLQIADNFACFDDLNDYFEFRLENDNKTDYKAVYPCPELDLKKIPKDESNK